MKITKPQQNYGTNQRNVQLKIDESFAEKQIPANDSVRLLDRIVEEMDLSALMRAYNSLGRKPATPPRIMLKILLYAGTEHNYASRKIHTACQRNINYIWLLEGYPAPSYNDIWGYKAGLRFSPIPASRAQEDFDENPARCHGLQHKQIARQDTTKSHRNAVICKSPGLAVRATEY